MLANMQRATIKPIIEAAVAKHTLVHTDEYSTYARVPAWGYRHKTVCMDAASMPATRMATTSAR
jgi:transposase